MAKVTAFQPIDMSNIVTQLGEVLYADEEVIIVEGDDSSTYYFGDYEYLDDELSGTIKRVQVYDLDDTLTLDVRGFELDTRFLAAGTTTLEATKKVLEGDDRILGSRGGDVLIGFSGDDAIRGGRGDDVLRGKRGADALSGGFHDDTLRGGLGWDVLAGGRGDDMLRGEEGRDVFVFDERDGGDVIRDFQNRKDKIQIEGGAADFDELEITEIDGDAHLAFARTEITLRDVDIADLGPGDFLFV